MLEKELIKIFENIEKGNFDSRIIRFDDAKNKYVNLKPRVTVSVEFTDGKSATIDVTDYFGGIVK